MSAYKSRHTGFIKPWRVQLIVGKNLVTEEKKEMKPTFNVGSSLKTFNEARSKMLKKIFGDRLKGMKILEVGAGHGEIGQQLIKEYDAKVTFTDGRQKHVDYLKSLGYNAFVMNQEELWTVDEKYDMVIHFSVLYHLINWKQDLKCAVETAPIVCLETEVSAGDKDLRIEDRQNDMDQCINPENIGVRPAEKNLEKYINEVLGKKFVRYDDSDLGIGGVRDFTWKTEDFAEKEPYRDRRRRFYVIEGNYDANLDIDIQSTASTE